MPLISSGPIFLAQAKGFFEQVKLDVELKYFADGVLAIPRAHEDAVLAAAEEIDAVEQQIRAAVKEGLSLAEARTRLGYHRLQTRSK